MKATLQSQMSFYLFVHHQNPQTPKITFITLSSLPSPPPSSLTLTFKLFSLINFNSLIKDEITFKCHKTLLCLCCRTTDVSLSLLYHHPTIFFPVNHQHLTIKVLVLTGTKEAEVNRDNQKIATKSGPQDKTETIKRQE